jgi:excisionase family DNA binding protein
MSFERLLTATEVSQALQIDLQRVYELTRRKLLPSVRLGERQLRFSPQAIEQFIAEGGNREGESKRGAFYQNAG